MLDNQYALLFIRGERPVQDFKYDILHHPNVRETTDGGAPAFTHGEDTRSIAAMSFVFDKNVVKQAQEIKPELHDFELLSEEELQEKFDKKEKEEHEKHQGEYAPLVEAMGNLGSVIRVSAGGRDRLNAMYMVDGYGENNPIVVKSEFIMSLIEQIDKKGVGPQHKSIIDRCITNVYRNAAEDGTVPTLCTLRDMLLEQPEPEAKQIALSLELYTTGSLDIFGKQSNVDLDKRIVVFDIHGLGSQLKPTGLLVITDTMLNRVTLNWKKGKRTHVFIDEFHVVFENEFSAQFFNSAWRQFRKRNAYPTAITQNVEYLLDSVQASTMLSNSEFVIMLNQAASDREKLARLLNISNEQMSYITNADAGCGLIKYGSALVPFINQFPHDTKLYQLMTTRPGEGEFARGQD